jgi:phosphomannomutase
VLPDPAEPVVHVYAEGDTDDEADRLAREASELVESIIERGEA